ncbi:MAG TPA: hypothetical protein VGD66_11610 [Allosphingosinicella sp.]
MILVAAFALLAAPVPTTLSRADVDAAFRAAGFRWRERRWRSDCIDLGNPSYAPGRIARVADLNGDGRPEAVIIEGSAACFGVTGTRFALVGKQADGRWRRIVRLVGIPRFLSRRGRSGWLDIELGGPGLCAPVYRRDGREYRLHHFDRVDGPQCPQRDPK